MNKKSDWLYFPIQRISSSSTTQEEDEGSTDDLKAAAQNAADVNFSAALSALQAKHGKLSIPIKIQLDKLILEIHMLNLKE